MTVKTGLHILATLVWCALGASAFAADVGQSEKITVTPAVGKVGEHFVMTCVNFPEPTGRDIVYVVAAGTPDFDVNSPAASQQKILWKDYAANCYRNSGAFYDKAGPFAPGAYEVRFSTTLYNNDGRGEIATRTPFSVK